MSPFISVFPNPLSHLQGASYFPGLNRYLQHHSPFTGQTKNNLTANRAIRRGGKNRTTEKRYKNQSKWGLNSKLKSKLVVKVNEVNLKKSVNIMNCASYRLKRRLNKLQSMHIAHLPPCFKGLMQLRGEKKEVIVTDKYQHTPKPSGQKIAA